MHPSVFNSHGPRTLKDYFQGLYEGYHEGTVKVSVTIDPSGLIHVGTSFKHEEGNKSDVEDMVIDSEDGYRIVSLMTEFRDLDTPGHRETQTYHVNWKRYGQQWYVISATYDRNDVVPVDGEMKPFTRSWSVNIEEYEADADIDDSEFTLAGLYEGEGMHVRDKIKGVAYRYGTDVLTEADLDAVLDDAPGLEGRVQTLLEEEETDAEEVSAEQEVDSEMARDDANMPAQEDSYASKSFRGHFPIQAWVGYFLVGSMVVVLGFFAARMLKLKWTGGK